MKCKKVLGIDAGSVSIKFAVVDSNKDVIYSHYENHNGRPAEVLYNALSRLGKSSDYGEDGSLKEGFAFDSVAVTGSARDFIGKILGVPTVNEIVAQANAVHYLNPGTKTIFEIGGQDSKFIQLDRMDVKAGPRILTQKMNDICAAGTGSFIAQQASRMCISLDTFSQIAATAENPFFIAGRCAVFSKTDVVHRMQEGVPQKDIAAGICQAVVRNYVAQFIKGKKVELPVIFQGGLAGNKGVVKAFREYLNLDENDFVVPKYYRITGAIGTALICLEKNEASALFLPEILEVLAEQTASFGQSNVSFFSPIEEQVNEIDGFSRGTLETDDDIFIGIDVGSTSTCAAVLNQKKELLVSQYLFNKENILDSVKNVIENIQSDFGGKTKKVKVAGIGVTGSGRILIGKYLKASVIKDEISAQAKAAVHIMPDVDTIIEIGGQDSKYIRIHDGQVADFEMNKVCAAGTGYFLQEQAKRLNIPIANMSDTALKSGSPCNLGSRCTVFMESDLVTFQQQGISCEDLVGGLSYSIVTNYLEKTVAGKEIGSRILFLGGVAFNKSVASAFKKVLNKELFVPENHEISAALGMALFAMEERENAAFDKMIFNHLTRESFKYDFSSFRCNSCTNYCRISKIKVDEFVYLSGGRCDKYEQGKERSNGDFPDLFKKREELLYSYLEAKKSNENECIGIPCAHMFFEYLPLYSVYLQELGFSVVVSDKSSSNIVKKGLEKTDIDNCLACKIIYGHVENLIEKGIKKIFFPSIIEYERSQDDLERNFTCPFVQAMPSIIQSTYPEVSFLIPSFYREKADIDWQKELFATGLVLGKSKKEVKKAIQKSADAYYDFRKKRESMGNDFLHSNHKDQVCVVLGKIYNVHDPILNLNLSEKLRNRGIIPIPFDCLPISKQKLPQNFKDMVWASGQDFIRAAKIVLENEDIHPIMITNFGCGPDSFIDKYKEELFRERPSLTLEIDEHTSGVGVITRIEAFLNNIKKSKVQRFEEVAENFQPFDVVSDKMKTFDKLLYIPIGFESYKAIGAAFQSIGVKIKYLPVHDQKTEQYGKIYTSGRECLPYIMHVGDVVRMIEDEDFNPEKCALYLPSSDLACRIAAFSTSIKFVLRKLGYPDFQIIAPRISVDNDEFLKFFGINFAVNLFRGMVVIELLNKLVAQIRPYEVHQGESDLVYTRSVEKITTAISDNGDFWASIKNVIKSFDEIEVDLSREKLLIGLVGDDYTRGNPYANNDIIKDLESLGVEVCTIPIWSSFFEFQMGMKPLKTMRRKRYFEAISDKLKSVIGTIDVKRINDVFREKLKYFPEPDFKKMMETTKPYLDERSEPLTLIALAHIIHLINSGVDGIINLVGFQCTIHNVVLAKLNHFFEKHHSIPNLSLSFDFQENGHHKNRIEAFLYQVEQHKKIKA